jgi:mannose-6-phosphate isomerase class I
VFEDSERIEKVTLRDAIADLKDKIIGERIWQKHESWPMYAKFFDNKGPLPHHIHHRDAEAQRVGQKGKPEAYYFPVQNNNYGADFPFTFFGLKPGTTKDQVRQCLRNFSKGDNMITNLSTAHRLEPGTGWDVPAGVLHAPGSLCTYEPQKASDVFSMFQSLTGGYHYA